VNTLRIGDCFVAKAPGRRVSAFSHTLYFCRGITAPSICILHDLTTSAGIFPCNDPRVHLSSGAESKVASLEVGWPSGIVRTVTNVAADQILKIEGSQK
jgi:ASPIC and UnbV